MEKRLFAIVLVWMLSGNAWAQKSQSADPLQGSYIRLIIKGGFTPYRVVTYDVFWRSGTAVAGNYRGLIHYDEPLHTMSLIAKDEYLGLWKQLEEASIWRQKNLPKPAKATAIRHFEIDVKMKGRVKKFTFSGLLHGPDKQHGALANYIRSFVLKYAGEMPFRNVFFETGTLGWVNLTSVPTAKVRVGGRDIGLTTPVYGYELPQGRHEVTLILPSGSERKHTLTVEPGMTTIVHIDLQ
ncbi:MAG TPA: PEGA domain-containing protein [Myxococcales bacterium]|nr:PEGA domain-containing protein [Myxococcales bacterium]